MQLSDLNIRDKGIIVKIKGQGAFRKRITDMGFIRGKEVEVVRNAPLQDPVEYRIMGYDVSLRRAEAELIEIVSRKEYTAQTLLEFGSSFDGDFLRQLSQQKQKTIHVALVGNPNCGKTTLFNSASGAREHVGNYSGVTVDLKKGQFKIDGYTINITDLPGTYSLTAYSPEELYVRRYITTETPDVVINVIDASNIERNMYLTTQLIDMDIRVVAALNMYDELQAKKAALNHSLLGQMLGIPFVPTVGSKGIGIKELFRKIIEVYENKSPEVRHIKINYGKQFENALEELIVPINCSSNLWLTNRVSARFVALKLLENDKDILKMVAQCSNFEEISILLQKWQKRLRNEFGEDTESVLADNRYGFIAGALRETYTEGFVDSRQKSERFDSFFTNKWLGFPVFFFFLWLMFQSTYTLGEFPMLGIEWLVAKAGAAIDTLMPNGMLKDLLIDGIIGGVGGVIVFLPNILILFFFISLMEDTGYMARVAFIMDKIMHKIGLHGKSFIPLIMGFGCNVPAILATRTLENRQDRLLTMLINPFMSCSARLPVYVLITGAFFPDNAGTVLFSIYATGILLAALLAIGFKKFIFKSQEAPFVMELPPYRIPTFKSIIRHMWHKGSQYLQKMGGVILVASILIWALGYFPREVGNELVVEQQIAAIAQDATLSDAEKDQKIKTVETQQQGLHQENSYIGRIGKGIEPVMQPLGFDWKMSVSILTGIVAKEVVVSTMGVLYQTNSSDESIDGLAQKIRNEKYTQGVNAGEPLYNKAVALAFLLFILIYFPCIAVVAAINKESGNWRWAAFTVVYTTSLAWLVAFVVYQVSSNFII